MIIERKHRDDPQKGRFGGKASANGRRLHAKVTNVRNESDWFDITLVVEPTGATAPPLQGFVRFFLHDSFEEDVRDVRVREGRAVLKLEAYGAFTVGVEADGGKTKLELDLSELEDAPTHFREN